MIVVNKAIVFDREWKEKGQFYRLVSSTISKIVTFLSSAIVDDTASDIKYYHFFHSLSSTIIYFQKKLFSLYGILKELSIKLKYSQKLSEESLIKLSILIRHHQILSKRIEDRCHLMANNSIQ